MSMPKSMTNCAGMTQRGYCGRKPLKDYGYCRQHLNEAMNSMKPQPAVGWLIANAGCDPRFRDVVNAELVEDYVKTLPTVEQSFFALRGFSTPGVIMAALLRFENFGVHHGRPEAATEAWDSMIDDAAGYDYKVPMASLISMANTSYRNMMLQGVSAYKHTFEESEKRANHWINILTQLGTPAGFTWITKAQYDAMVAKQTKYDTDLAAYQAASSLNESKLNQYVSAQRKKWAKANTYPQRPTF